jgi:hypothetical protein
MGAIYTSTQHLWLYFKYGKSLVILQIVKRQANKSKGGHLEWWNNLHPTKRHKFLTSNARNLNLIQDTFSSN